MKRLSLSLLLVSQIVFADYPANLTQKIGTLEDNWVYSPLSISFCLEMVAEGALGETEEEMRAVLPPSADNRPISFWQHTPLTSTDFELNIAEGVWIKKGFAILPSYQEILKTSFHAAIESVPFTQETAFEINQWIEQQTHQKIRNLIAPENLSQQTEMVLVNALYFRGNWLSPFSEKNSRQDLFYCSASDPVKAPFMEQTHFFPYVENDRYQAILLPFATHSKKSCHPACLLLLPTEDTSASCFTQSLEEVLHSLAIKQVHVRTPKFKIEQKIELTEILKQLGMNRVFTPLADLSGINGQHNLFLSAVLHKTFFAFEENGVEAAAATAAVINRTSISPPSPIFSFHVNRPFYFALLDLDTKTIFFIGHIQRPCF